MIQDLHDDIVHELLKRGMLKKRGHVRKNWKDRYFVLTVRLLTYYESQGNLTKKVKQCDTSFGQSSTPSSRSKFHSLCFTNLGLHLANVCQLKGSSYIMIAK